MTGGPSTDLDEWRWVALSSLSLSDEKLLEVLALVERIADRDQAREVLHGIRPRLIQLRPLRRLHAQRLLFRPVEDLFDQPERYRSHIGRLSRRVIAPCWQMLSATLESDLLADTAARLDQVDLYDPGAIIAIGLPLWHASASLLRRFLGGGLPPGRNGVAPQDLEVELLEQMSGIAAVLDVAEEIEIAKGRLPHRPVATLSTADVDLLCAQISQLAAASASQLQAFLQVILARLSKPGELLKVLDQLRLPQGDGERQSLVQAIGSSRLAGLVFEAQDLRRAGIRTDQIGDTARTAERLAQGFLSLETALGGLSDRRIAAKVRAARGEIGAVVREAVMDRAEKTLFAALVSDQLATADYGAPAAPAMAAAEVAEASANALRRCGRIAEAVGIKPEIGRRLQAICDRLEHSPRDPIIEPGAREAALMRSVRLIELIAGPDDAMRALERGRKWLAGEGR
ncbi:MAG: hypothetical protein GC191_10755 [Azospirillum sp.]|nr:hypothetical protein [Azospirillum sp.]